jgi:glycosidase
MPWTSEKNAGFTTASARPWLPLGETGATNVDNEKADPGSVLNFWRRLASLRGARRIGGVDRLERVLLDDQVWAYRVGEVTTVANLSDQVAARQLATDETLTVLASSGSLPPGTEVGRELHLEPWETLVLSTRP